MERFIQHDPLFIRHFKTLHWPFPMHNHNHFELMFLHSGAGFHELNGERKPYLAPCLFFLAPADYHIFNIQEETEFSVLKFSNSYLAGGNNTSVNQDWNRLLDQLLAISAVQGASLVKPSSDLDKIEQLMRLIVLEWQESFNAANEVVLSLIRAVFALIKKNVFSQHLPEQLQPGNLFLSIMDYVHRHIHQPEQLRLEALSTHFNFSANHLSALFKKQMGVSIKSYIDDYKFKLIENRLKFSDLMIKEISLEFGFSDLSHFNKFLKTHGNSGPKNIRQQNDLPH